MPLLLKAANNHYSLSLESMPNVLRITNPKCDWTNGYSLNAFSPEMPALAAGCTATLNFFYDF